MMKRNFSRLTLLALAICCWAFALPANAGKGAMKYKMDYIIEEHLYVKGNQLTFLKTNIEWPQYLAGSDIPGLQKYLCQLLFFNEQTSCQGGWDAFIQTLGKEIKSMPDEGTWKKQYITIYLQQLGGVDGKFMSFYAQVIIRKGDANEPSKNEQKLFTYDIINDKVLFTKDILVKSVLYGNFEHEHFANIILANDRRISDDFFIHLPDQVCLLQEGMLFNLKGSAQAEGFDQVTFVRMNRVGPYMRRAVKKWYDSKERADDGYLAPPMKLVTPADVNDTVTIFDKVESMPQFKGGESAMIEYLSKTVVYPEIEQQLGRKGKVVVSFVVERDGKVTRPAVLSPISPSLDREAVEAVLAMPAWIPGKYHDVPVRTRMIVPVNFQLK